MIVGGEERNTWSNIWYPLDARCLEELKKLQSCGVM